MYIIWIKSPALAFSKEYAELVLELKSFPKKSALSLPAGSLVRASGKYLAACKKRSEKSEKWKVSLFLGPSSSRAGGYTANWKFPPDLHRWAVHRLKRFKTWMFFLQFFITFVR